MVSNRFVVLFFIHVFVLMATSGCHNSGRIFRLDDGDVDDSGSDGDADGDVDADADETPFSGDADGRADGDTDSDADFSPCGSYWRAIEAPSSVVRLIEGPSVNHWGAPVQVEVVLSFTDSCQGAGPALKSIDRDNKHVTITPYAWVHENTGCLTRPHTQSFEILFYNLVAGDWTFTNTITNESFQVTVVADLENCAEPVWPNLEEGDECTSTCQCVLPFQCVARNALKNEGRACHIPCSIDEECDGRQCLPVSEGGSYVCSDRTEHQCDMGSPEDCPSGYVCEIPEGQEYRACIPDVEFDDGTRHECSCDSDCETPGTECVHRSWEGGDGSRRCEFRCSSDARFLCGYDGDGAGQCLNSGFTCTFIGEL